MSLKAKALQYLAQRDHSRQELRLKLLRWEGRSAATARDAGDQLSARAKASLDPSDGDEANVEMLRDTLEARVDAVLDGLIDNGLLSDARFAQSRVQARQARFGNRRISGELRQHGVALDDEQLCQLRDSELERAQQVLAARFSASTSNPAQLNANELQRLLARQHRFLAARGFSSDTIRQALKYARSADPN